MRRLDRILNRFRLRHLDLLSADCEGCEEGALAGFDLKHTSVGALLVEKPSCALAKPFVDLGYTAMALWFSYDFVFLSPRVSGHAVALLLCKGRGAREVQGTAQLHKLLLLPVVQQPQ